MISNLFFGLFILALAANAFALFRHYQALRMFNIVLANLTEAQQQFNELNERDKTSRPPRPEPSVPFAKS